MNKEQIKEKYLTSTILYRLLEKKREKLLTIISVLRFFIFFGGLVLVWIGFTFSVSDGVILIVLFTVWFLWLLKLFSKHSEKREFLSNLASINQNEADALSGDLKAFDAGNSYNDIHHDFSFDVDLFGTASLFQYLNRTVTDYGKDILASWLSDPYILSKDLLLRQNAIKELASKDKWRHRFMASGMKTPLEKNEISSLLNWMQERALLSSSAINRVLILSLPAVAIVSLILAFAGVLPYPVFGFIFIGNLLYIAARLKSINRIHNALSRKYKFLSSIDRLLKAFENESFNSPLLNDIKLNISGKNISAARSVKKLGRLIQAFDTRNNQIVGLVLNGMLLWDYQSIMRLEKWKSDYKSMFPTWLNMIGQVDALISLGNYAYNNPDFVFAVESENKLVFSAKNLGHQLIDERKRVCNDFSLGKKGTVCIISGANMAGKSTFLRTVAVNYILAMTGAPVCASELNFIPGKLFTSMRTIDSLSNNESYFYAELRRLFVLKTRIESGEPVFSFSMKYSKGQILQIKVRDHYCLLRK